MPPPPIKGLYAAELKNLFLHYRRDRVKVYDFKTFAADPSEVANSLVRSLGLAPHDYSAKMAKNDRGFWVLRGADSKSDHETPYDPMLPESRQTLRDFYAGPDRELLALLPDTPLSWIATDP